VAGGREGTEVPVLKSDMRQVGQAMQRLQIWVVMIYFGRRLQAAGCQRREACKGADLSFVSSFEVNG